MRSLQQARGEFRAALRDLELDVLGDRTEDGNEPPDEGDVGERQTFDLFSENDQWPVPQIEGIRPASDGHDGPIGQRRRHFVLARGLQRCDERQRANDGRKRPRKRKPRRR